MRRSLALLACVALLLGTGCAYAAASARQGENAYQLYFRETHLDSAPGGDAFRTETVYLEDAEMEDPRQTAEILLTELLAGPQDQTLRSTIPAGTALLSVDLAGSRAKVDLSSAYGTLSGVGLTLADYAVTLTLTQLPEITSVTITVRGRELDYRDKQVFAARDVLLSSTEDVVGTLPVSLYFLDEEGALTAEQRTLELYEGDTQVQAVVGALEAGPENKSLASALPEGFRIKSAWLEEDVCYVNLSSVALEEAPSGPALQTAVQALVRSLGSLSAVGEVQFLVDGEFTGFYGPVDVTGPYAV